MKAYYFDAMDAIHHVRASCTTHDVISSFATTVLTAIVRQDHEVPDTLRNEWPANINTCILFISTSMLNCS